MVWFAPVSTTYSTTMNRLSTGVRDFDGYLKCSHFPLTAAAAEGAALCAISARCSGVRRSCGCLLCVGWPSASR